MIELPFVVTCHILNLQEPRKGVKFKVPKYVHVSFGYAFEIMNYCRLPMYWVYQVVYTKTKTIYIHCFVNIASLSVCFLIVFFRPRQAAVRVEKVK